MFLTFNQGWLSKAFILGECPASLKSQMLFASQISIAFASKTNYTLANLLPL